MEIQPKGLLATEGCVSFPLTRCPGPVLAVRSHFFEFQEIDAPERLRLAHELEQGGQYRVVLTTAGGLYRYELRDEVEVLGFESQCPLVRFVGRSDGGCDLVGEKLAESHVRAVLDRLLDEQGIMAAFTLLVPIDDRPPRYRLYLQLPSPVPGEGQWVRAALIALACSLEAGLCENPHYAYARRLGQLAPAEIVVLDPHEGPAWELYERQCLARGMRLGNIKPKALDAWPGWPAVFAPFQSSNRDPLHPRR